MTDDLQALAARLETLEVRCAYQDQAIEELNEMVVQQWTKLDHALRKVAELEERLREMRESQGHDVQDEPPPPHY
ncbi:SlyX family protein [uncultured Alsobacter sp.]|uniref:SlyX family protein n=1 Tax=uncultured Alsobacter sp. TaxID=1748258 RepID=UPI0025D851CD|nr:SlyX family protein [uncultured Alsobacter sp.]